MALKTLTTKETAKKYWRYFLPSWLFPFYLMFYALVLNPLTKGSAGLENAGLIFTYMLFIGCMIYTKAAPYGPEVDKGTVAFLWIGGPFIIWIGLCFTVFPLFVLGIAIVNHLGYAPEAFSNVPLSRHPSAYSSTLTPLKECAPNDEKCNPFDTPENRAVFGKKKAAPAPAAKSP